MTNTSLLDEQPIIEPSIVKRGFLDMQVCVPKDFTDNQIVDFAEQENPCGTSGGWMIRKQGDAALLGASERTPCAEREEFVHIMLDA